MKSLLLLSVLLFLPLVSFCQNAVTQASYYSGIQKTIVKEYDYPATISYVETQNEHYFAYADASMTIVNCEVSPNIFVRDFVIFNHKVYFCGLDISSSSPVGVWGWFNVSDLIVGSLTYETYNNFVCGQEYVDTLHSLTVYEHNGQLHIVAVGSTFDGVNTTNGCTVEITPNTVGPLAWSYRIGVTPNISGERIIRVCNTDNLVVTSGPSGMLAFEVYRLHYKSDLFMPNGLQDTIWYFAFSSLNPCPRYIEEYSLTPMYGDYIAAAFRMKNNKTLNYGILVYAYDMSHLVVGTTSTYFSRFITIDTIHYFNVKGLEYDGKNDALVLLLNGKYPPFFPNSYGSIIAEIPITTTLPSPANLTYVDDIEYSSLDLYNNRQNFLCLGPGYSQTNNDNYFTQPLNSATSQCADLQPVPINEDLFLTKDEIEPYTVCGTKFNCAIKSSIGSITINNDVICSQRNDNPRR